MGGGAGFLEFREDFDFCLRSTFVVLLESMDYLCYMDVVLIRVGNQVGYCHLC